MKILNIAILILLSNFVFGQRSNTIFHMSENKSPEFTRQDYIDNNLTKISVYSFSINKQGKLKKDSLLLYQHNFDISANKLWGLNGSTNYLSHGPSFLTWEEFETYYNDNGQIIKNIRKPHKFEKKTTNGYTDYNIITNETDYEYDSLKREIKKTDKTITLYYSTSKYTEDTALLEYIQSPKIEEYLYNSDNQKIKWYRTVDSTRYSRTKTNKQEKDSITVKCSYCHSRYLDFERKYNFDKNLIESVSYTTENLMHTKMNFYYDSKNRLIKEIDSTGWYFTTVEPYWLSTTTYQYSDTGKIVTKISNTGEILAGPYSKIVSCFDANNNLIKECKYFDSSANCTQYSFTYNKDKLVKDETYFDNGTNSSTIFLYNERGHLKEERTFINNKLTNLVRYYYE